MILKPIKLKNDRDIEVITQNGQRVNVHVTPRGKLFVTVYTGGNEGAIELNNDVNDFGYLTASARDGNKAVDITLVTSYGKIN